MGDWAAKLHRLPLRTRLQWQPAAAAAWWDQPTGRRRTSVPSVPKATSGGTSEATDLHRGPWACTPLVLEHGYGKKPLFRQIIERITWAIFVVSLAILPEGSDSGIELCFRTTEVSPVSNLEIMSCFVSPTFPLLCAWHKTQKILTWRCSAPRHLAWAMLLFIQDTWRPRRRGLGEDPRRWGFAVGVFCEVLVPNMPGTVNDGPMIKHLDIYPC